MTKIREVSMETAVISAVLASNFQEQNPTSLVDSFPLKSYLMIIKADSVVLSRILSAKGTTFCCLHQGFILKSLRVVSC